MKHTVCKLTALLLTALLTLSAAVPALADTASFSYEGSDVTFIKADGSGFGMFAPQDGTTAALDGDNVVIHYVPKNTATYNALHWGAISDAELTCDVAANADGSYDITLPKTVCGTAIPAAPVKASGATTSAQYYLAVPAAEKLSEKPAATTADYTAVDAAIANVPSDLTLYTAESAQALTGAVAAVVRDLGADQQAQVDAMAQAIEQALTGLVLLGGQSSDGTLTVTNTTNMFKAVSARLVTENSRTCLVVALNGTSYQNLFPGTYEEAVANGDNRENWIKASVNTAGKYEFILPLEENQTYVPAVSVSNTYLNAYEQGKNPLARAFYPRQFVIDYEAKTLTVGDYDHSADLAVTNQVSMFKVAAAALHTVGGPNSNSYRTDLVLTMGSAAYDKARIVSGAVLTDETEPVALGEGNTFVLPVRWIVTAGDPDSVVNLLAAPLVMSFHSAKKDAWYDRLLTVSEEGGTLVASEVSGYIDTTEPDSAVWSPDGPSALTITVERENDGADTLAHFAGVRMDGKAVDPAHYEVRSGSVILTFQDAYLKTLAAGSHTVTVLFDDGQLTRTVQLNAAAVSPATGDSGAAVWIAAALISLLGGIILLLRRRESSR